MYMKIVISETQFDKLIKQVKDGERFIKCDSCKRWFTQTFHKGKKSLPICPWCGRHNTQFNENQDVEEKSRSFTFTRKKRLFTKAELTNNPARYSEYQKEIGEIDVYKFSEKPTEVNPSKPDPNEYRNDKNSYTFMKEVGDFEYLCEFLDQEGIAGVTIHVMDRVNKTKVAVAEFEQRTAEDFFIALPYVKPEYRKRGIANEIYKLILSFGNLISGKAQSHQAVGLWKKMYRELPNKMVFVDERGKEHNIETKGDSLVVSDTGEDVHNNNIGGYLKLYKN